MRSSAAAGADAAAAATTTTNITAAAAIPFIRPDKCQARVRLGLMGALEKFATIVGGRVRRQAQAWQAVHGAQGALSRR